MRFVYHGSVGARLALVAVVCASACAARLGDGPLGPWSPPTRVPGASDPTLDTDNETLDSTMTEMYFTIVDTALTGNPKQLWVMTRPHAGAAWGTPTTLDVVNTPVQTESPRLSPDDLTLYFGRNGSIYTTTRTARGQPWGAPQPLAAVNTGAYAKWMAVCDNNYFMLSRDGGTGAKQDLFAGTLGDVGMPCTELNSSGNEISTFLSRDCLTVYFASDRSGTTQMYSATRPTATAPWPAPALVTDFGMGSTNKDGWLSDDQRTFYFASIRDGATLRAVYVSTR
jgi:hypothetical protein